MRSMAWRLPATPLYFASAVQSPPERRALPQHHAPVAQPDRVVASEAIGRGFESLQARHLPPGLFLVCAYP